MVKQLKIVAGGLGLVVLLSSASIAGVPNAPGPYIGVTNLNGASDAVRLSFKDNSNNEIYNMIGIYEAGSAPANPTPQDDFVAVKAVPATSDSYAYVNINGLECDKVYKAVAFSYNNDGYSAPSSVKAFNIHTTLGISCSPIEVDAGADKTVSMADGEVTLHATITKNSYPDDHINATWLIKSKPNGSSATVDSNGLDASFVPDVAGVYKLKVIIMNNDHLDSDSDTVTVIVTQ